MAKKSGVPVANAKAGALVSVDELMKQQAAAIAGRIAQPGGAKIQVKNNKTFIFPDGQSTGGPVDLVVLDFISANYYYDKPFKEGEPAAPACFAMGNVPNDDLVPDETSPDKQGDEDGACLKCPQNQFGTKGDGKACQNRCNLAVLPPDADEDTPIMILSLSPTAIKSFAGYAATLANVMGVPPIGVISQIGFDPKSEYATIRFGKPTVLDKERKAFFIGRQKEATEKLNAKPDVSLYEAPKAKSTARGKAARR
jgi:hypothetical protein